MKRDKSSLEHLDNVIETLAGFRTGVRVLEDITVLRYLSESFGEVAVRRIQRLPLGATSLRISQGQAMIS